MQPAQPVIPRLFLALGLLFGACYVFVNPPLQAPDEFAHWFRAYSVSEGYCIAPGMTPIPASVLEMSRGFPVDMRLWRRISPNYARRYLHQPLDPGKQDRVRNDAINVYHCLPYIPGALGVGAGRLFHQSPEAILYLCRLANLLTYIGIVYLALRQLPGFQVPMLLLALMPMALSQAASASWDGPTFALGFFLCAYILKLAWDPQITVLTRKHWGILAALTVCASLSKLDGWLVLLLFLIPASKFGGFRRKAIVVSSLIAFSLAIIAGWNYVNRVNMAMWVEDIQRSRNILFSYNASFLLNHPWIFVESALHTFNYTLLEQFVGRLGWLSVILPRWTIVTYAVLMIVAAVTDGFGARLDLPQRLVSFGTVMVGAGFIFAGIWCANTTQADIDAILHGGRYIVGMQGRYFIPFAFPLFLAMAGRRQLASRKWLAGIAAAAILAANSVALAAVRSTFYRVGDTTGDYDQKATEMNLQNLGPALAGSTTDISGGWATDGYYKGLNGPGPLPGGGPVFGTYPDANTGTIRVGPFQLDGHTEIAIPVVTGPVARNLSITVREAVDKDVLAQLKPSSRQKWWAWHPHLPTGFPIAVEVVAEDKGGAWGEWLAIGLPHSQLPWGTELAFSKFGAAFPEGKPEIAGAWVPNGYFKGAGGPGTPPVAGAVYGSFPDAATGSIRLGPFELDAHTRIAIPVVTGPDTRGLSAIVRDAASKQILAVMDPPPMRQAWWGWQPALPADRKITVEVVAEDKGSGWGQWLALGWPHAIHE